MGNQAAGPCSSRLGTCQTSSSSCDLQAKPCNRCQFEPVRGGGIFVGTHGILEHLREDEVTEPMPRADMNFEAMDAIPDGWQQVQEPVPEGFLVLGGAGCVIRETLALRPRSPRPGKRVLLAWPGWAVDLHRAKNLVQQASNLEVQTKVCRLWRVHSVSHFNTVVFEFDMPRGESLSERLERDGPLPETSARSLCARLLRAVSELQRSSLWLWGIVHSSMTFLDRREELCTLLPLGCLLSFKGAKGAAVALAEKFGKSRVAPELDRAVVTTERLLVQDAGARLAADTYGVAALILEALALVGPDDVRNGRVTSSLPEVALDLLHKVLHVDHTWRLTGQDALEHRWLVGSPNSARKMPAAV
mmetsp:Transcript_2247/g.5058  ORF Transcript_2247/g.5058 Transcript_2247/m.5058 type:complete len:360 (+) Transcript_2247:58-1137(+)